MTLNTNIGRERVARACVRAGLAACAGLTAIVTLGCSSGATAPPKANSTSVITTCGNGRLDPGEECDGTVGTATCASATSGAFPGGTLVCAPECVLDKSMCLSATGEPGPAPTSTGPAPGGGGGGAGPGPGPGPGPIAGGEMINVAGYPPVGTGGTRPIGTGGAPPVGGAGPVGAGGSAPQGKMDPTIPPVSGECPNWVNGTITFMGLAGITIAAGPKPAEPSAPMLIYWHGTGSTAGEYAFMAAPIANGVTAAGGVIVSFQGTTGGDLNSGTLIFGASDLKLIDQFVACAVKDHNIDPRKIYTAGCSAGGLMATATAVLRSQYIAAAAPNSGGVTVPPAFQGPHTPPLMTVHGAPGSDVVIVDFSQTSASADMLFKQRGGFVMDCNTGGGHCGGAGLAGDAWKFFQAHPFGVDPEPYASGLPAGFSTQCKIQ